MGMDATKDTVIRRQVLRNTASNYGAKLITLGTWFLLTPFILHQLGPSEYGLWVVVGSAVAYGTLLNFGISGTVIKYVAEYRARGENLQAGNLIATALCLYSVFGFIAAALSIAIAPVLPGLLNVSPEDWATTIDLVRLMGLGIGISIPCATPAAVLWALHRFDISNLISIIGTLLSAAATIGVLLLGGGVLGMVMVSIAVMVIIQAPTIWFINRIAPELRFGWSGSRRALVSKVLSFSWPFFAIDVADRLQNKSDEIVVGSFLPISAVTPYAIARRLSQVPQILADQFMRVLIPLASELHAENDQARLRAVYLIGTRLTLALFIPVGCVLLIFARPILTGWVGPAYADYSYLVTILTLASFIDTSQWPAGSVLQGMGRHRPLAIIAVGTGVANVALSILLVQKYGLMGVALGTLIPTSIGCLGFALPYAMSEIGVSIREALNDILLPAFLPAIPMGAILYLFQQWLEPSSLFSIMTVAGSSLVVYLMGYMSAGICTTEREACRSFVRSTVVWGRFRLKTCTRLTGKSDDGKRSSAGSL